MNDRFSGMSRSFTCRRIVSCIRRSCSRTRHWASSAAQCRCCSARRSWRCGASSFACRKARRSSSPRSEAWSSARFSSTHPPSWGSAMNTLIKRSMETCCSRRWRFCVSSSWARRSCPTRQATRAAFSRRVCTSARWREARSGCSCIASRHFPLAILGRTRLSVWAPCSRASFARR